jgi:hypothetical protein
VLLTAPTTTAASTADQITKAANQLKTGDNILLGGLGVNLASFFVFILEVSWPSTTVLLKTDLNAQITYFDYKTRQLNAPQGKWRKLLYAVYASTILVLIRQTYRVIEFSQGWLGYLPTHEGYFYVFDSLAILLASAVYVWFWPTRYIPRDSAVRLGDGVEWREMTGRERRKAAMQGSQERLAPPGHLDSVWRSPVKSVWTLRHPNRRGMMIGVASSAPSTVSTVASDNIDRLLALKPFRSTHATKPGIRRW